MATDYYVIVSTPDDGIIKKLSGKLWSTYHKDATEEARQYQEKLNGGFPMEVLLGKYHAATATPASSVRHMKGVKRGRPTEKKDYRSERNGNVKNRT